jgi:TetR/AcrR family transcriptional repressor of mexJK operon
MKSEAKTERAPGRPKDPSKHAAILWAAGHSFLERGFNDTTMDRVAKAAGVSKQTVYSHFSTKEALFQQVIEKKCMAYALDHPPVDPDQDLVPALEDFLRRHLDLNCDTEVVAMTRQVIAQSATSSTMAELFYASGPANTTRALAELLATYQARGLLELTDPTTAAADLLASTGARFRFELMTHRRTTVSTRERESEVRRQVVGFLAFYGRSSS